MARSGCGRIKIGSEWWSIVVVCYPLKGAWGYYDANLKLIVLDGTAKNKEFLDTLIHESSHGLDRTRPERVILKQGNALADILTAFGYRN